MYAAIDPGLSGGIAWRGSDGWVQCAPMPGTPMDILQFFQAFDTDVFCTMEKVGAHRQGNNASASVTFARHCGQLDMALLIVGWETQLVTATQWMRPLIGKPPKERKGRKDAIKAKVQQQCPYLGARITLKTADAIGILLSQGH